VHPELEFALARARQEQRAARLLSNRGHLAEGLRLTLRALDSAFQAAQLASMRNEPAAALRALRFQHEERALAALRRARTLDVPTLDGHVDFSMRVLMRDAIGMAHDIVARIERLSASPERSFVQRFARLFGTARPLSIAGHSSAGPSARKA
jgi:hypothetical protein